MPKKIQANTIILDKLETVLIYPARKESVFVKKKSRMMLKPFPSGEGHIFRVMKTEDGRKMTGFSMCDKSEAQLFPSRQTVKPSHPSERYGVCAECQANLKAERQGLWQKWVTGTPLGDTPAPIADGSASKPKPKRRKNVRK